MSSYADPELLISGWLHTRLGEKTWADPRLPDNWKFTAPIGHVQRGQGFGDSRYNLDTVLLDVDWYASNADHARALAERTRYELRVVLPGAMFGSALVTAVDTFAAPSWAPDPSVFRRTAAYQVWFAGTIS